MHTDLPQWRWDQGGGRPAGWWLRKPDGEPAIYVTKLGSTVEGRAELLRAVINHDALVEALEFIERECLHGDGDGCVAGETARAALAAARGGTP